MVIQMAGYAWAGKDFCGDLLVDILNEEYGAYTAKAYSYADALKNMAAERLGITRAELDANKEEYRQLLIDIGQEKRNIDKDYWIDAVNFGPEPIHVIRDCRFKNEAARGDVVLWVFPRAGYPVKEDDGGELNYRHAQWYINNTDDLALLRYRIKERIERMRIMGVLNV